MIKTVDDQPQRKVQADLKGKDVLQAADIELEQKKNQCEVNRPLTSDELKERAATHTRLKEAVEEQVTFLVYLDNRVQKCWRCKNLFLRIFQFLLYNHLSTGFFPIKPK